MALHALDALFRESLARIKVIAWDLDGTLGPMPGWDGEMPVCNYVLSCQHLADILTHLTNRYNVYHVLVSRNGMFCGETFTHASSMFLDLGFHRVLSCYRDCEYSKVATLTVAALTSELYPQQSVLLIDDQIAECVSAAEDGAVAMHVREPVLHALRSGNFALISKTLL